MTSVYIASFNRASDDAIKKLRDLFIKEKLYTDNWRKTKYILAIGDRTEVFDFALSRYRENYTIMHIEAGEISCWTTFDDVARHSITLMSELQLCTNKHAKDRVDNLCKSVDKEPNSHVVGNLWLDTIEIDESIVPEYEYDLILYNPPCRFGEDVIKEELEVIKALHERDNYIWIAPNGDKYSNLVMRYVTHSNLPRAQFLGLMKNCKRYITNSSSQYCEAPFVMEKGVIIPIGVRNIDRESKYSDMTIKDASKNILKYVKEFIMEKENEDISFVSN